MPAGSANHCAIWAFCRENPLPQPGAPDRCDDRSRTRLLLDMGLDTLDDCRPPVPTAGLRLHLMVTPHESVRGTVAVFSR